MSNYQFETTADGSPTVRILDATADSASESMHSFQGALSETLYIYGDAIATGLGNGFSPRVLSMGLGLGYVEILTAAEFLRHDRVHDAGGESFEIEAELRDWYTDWATEGRLPPPTPRREDFTRAYNDILERIARATQQDPIAVKALLGAMLTDGRWQIRGALGAMTTFHQRFGCICFDAFSAKSSPELWTEPFLFDFFAAAAEPGCVLSTYACTGTLKRALKASGFAVQVRAGFSSKRDSTFAVRK